MAGSTRDEATLASVNDWLYDEGLTDGLPVVPPTEDLLDEILRGTDLPRDRTLATVGEDGSALTVEVLAANAVMAGCTPIHLPVLVAGARAMDHPDSAVDDAMADPGAWAFQWIVNGPVREALDIRSDTGAFGPGFMANRCIGRALGLAYQNAAGIDLNDSDDRTGTPFKYTLVAGENEERSPWDPHHVDVGYDRADSTITLSCRRSFIQFIPYSMDAEGVLRAMQYNTIPDMIGSGAHEPPRSVVHTVAPYNADDLAEAGLSKADVKAYLADNSVLPYDEIGPPLEADRLSEVSGVTPLQARQIDDPDRIQLYVVGGSGRFSAVGHARSGPVTREIEFPDGWDDLIDEYAVEREWGEIAESYDAGPE